MTILFISWLTFAFTFRRLLADKVQGFVGTGILRFVLAETPVHHCFLRMRVRDPLSYRLGCHASTFVAFAHSNLHSGPALLAPDAQRGVLLFIYLVPTTLLTCGVARYPDIGRTNRQIYPLPISIYPRFI